MTCMLASVMMLAQDGLAVGDVQNSGCLRNTRGDASEPLPTIVLTREGNVLSVQLLNYESNCGTADFNVASSVSGGSNGEPCSVSISVVPYLPGDEVMDCICPYNVSFTVRDLESNSFYLSCWWYDGQVTLEEGKPLVLEDVREEATIDGMKYILRKAMGRALLADGSTQEGEVTIPSKLNYEGKTYQVTGISFSAFNKNNHLTKVVIPKTIKNMDLSNGIGIDSNPFSGCTALQSIEVEEGNPAVCSVDGVLFNKGKNKLISYPAGSLRESYTVPESVTWIEGLAFSYSQHLRKVTLTDNVTSLGYSAFYESKSLEEVRLSSGLRILASYLFGNCPRLKSVTIPQNVTSLGLKAFYGCTSLTSVTMPESITKTDYSVFEGCTSLSSVTLSPNLEEIMNNMFTNCSSLKEILIPNGVTTVRSEAFKNCSALTSLDLPESVTRLGSMVFAGCKLNTLYIRGIIVSNWFDSNIFRDMNTQTKLYVQPSEVERYQAVYKGPVYPLQENDTDNSDYIPFVELGKVWHVVYSDNPTCPSVFLTYYMYKEEERDGKTYILIHRSIDEQQTSQPVGLFREENRRVYEYDEATGREYMLYDFTLKESDTFTYEPEPDYSLKCKVLKQGWLDDGPQIASSFTLTSADTIDIKYRRLRTWTIGCENKSGEYREIATWVEGVGTLENMFCSLNSVGQNCLAYIERKDNETSYHKNDYLPFSFYNMFGHVHGCNLPTGAENNEEDDEHHKLTYELEGDRLHVYGEVFCNCGPNHYAYFCEKPTDDPSVYKIEFITQDVEPLMWCVGLHATGFYVSGFDPNLNYIVVDNQGVEHPVINKTSQLAYRPFVEDGKVWKVGDITSGNPAQCVEHFYFDGDTIVGGKACKKMMCQRYVNPDFHFQRPALYYVGAWYEVDKKVYFCVATNNQFKLMYDFSIEDNGTFQTNGLSYVIGSRQTGGIKGFKGVHRGVREYGDGEDTFRCAPWLEGVGGVYGPPTTNVFNVELADPMWFLMSCTVGDEVIYFNDGYEDGATPGVLEARKRIDFTHTIKIKPKSRTKREAEPSLYGEYSEQQLGINLNPLDNAYLVCISDETGKTVYEKTVNAGNIVGLNIDISAYAEGRYTVTVENDNESFTGGIDTRTTGIKENGKIEELKSGSIYNLQGQRISTPRKGLNIVNGRKVFVK